MYSRSSLWKPKFGTLKGYSDAWPLSTVLPTRTPFKHFQTFTVNVQNCSLFHACLASRTSDLCSVIPAFSRLPSRLVCRFCYIHAPGCSCMSVLTNIRLVQSYSLGSFVLLFSVILLHWFGSQNWVCAVLFPPLTLIERFVIFSIVLVRVHQVYTLLFPCLRLVVRYTKFCTIQYCFCSGCFASQMPVL